MAPSVDLASDGARIGPAAVHDAAVSVFTMPRFRCSRCRGFGVHDRVNFASKRAATAIAHKLIVVIHHVLFGRKVFTDLGNDYLDQRSGERTRRSLVRRLERLGFQVDLTPLQPDQEADSLDGSAT